ncbi:Outer membrane protein assembly factor BamD [Georgfuchsia toluolica]|uniref:Outer membrane protein assembly factor BamD n=1 Tax=Georgfuchsia toluolica TaxID=424218 RepID=A0A916NGW8_9PROT|nr:Outer membrane protein assembly factor BamD [Georgfuchsia toluolica]
MLIARSVAAIAAILLLLAGCAGSGKDKDETSGWSAEKIYTEARGAMSDGAWDKAIKLFEKLESRYPYGRYAQQAQLEEAYAYYKQDETTSAVAACDRFMKLHPNHPSVDYAYYLKGLANFNEDLGLFGNLTNQDQSERDPKAARESFNAFKDLVAKFPNSKYSPDAVARMVYLNNFLAAHDVHVAKYYYRRGAYIAAANRAEQSIKQYPNAPATEEALILMVRSYDALGIKDLRDDALRVLKKNFPKTDYATKVLETEEPWWKLW